MREKSCSWIEGKQKKKRANFAWIDGLTTLKMEFTIETNLQMHYRGLNHEMNSLLLLLRRNFIQLQMSIAFTALVTQFLCDVQLKYEHLFLMPLYCHSIISKQICNRRLLVAWKIYACWRRHAHHLLILLTTNSAHCPIWRTDCSAPTLAAAGNIRMWTI